MKKLEFDGLQNARDISYGSIKEGRLIRSEALTDLTEADVECLAKEYNLKAIIDLRTPEEAQKADLEIPGAAYYAIPLMDVKQLGVTREEGTTEELARRAAGKADAGAGAAAAGAAAAGAMAGFALPNLSDVYLTFVGKESQAAWTKIFDLFADNTEGAVLWHCTAGKDRCGLVSAAIEHCLGLSDEQIMEDYLISNEHPVVPEQMAALAQTLPEPARKAFDDLFIAKEEYLNSAFAYIDAHYGGMDGFLEQVCGVDAEKKARIRANYLA